MQGLFTAFQWTFVFVLAIIGASWWLTVPGLMHPSTFAALFGVLGASIWVVASTFQNARPASSLAQSLHDVEAATLKPSRRSSRQY